MTEMITKAKMNYGGKYKCFEEFVLRCGTQFKARKLDLDEYGEIGKCFYNALEYAVSHPNVLYVEGYAIPRDLIPILHGWCCEARSCPRPHLERQMRC